MKQTTILLILSLILTACIPIDVSIEIPDESARGPPDQAKTTTPSNDTITIASFNIQTFGPTKAGKPEVMSILAEIISRYDIVAIQEIRDKSGEAINALEAEVDALGTDYSYIIGPRLGRTSMKEQYAFMYRTDTIGLIGDYTYSDPYDIFHREPYMAWFTTRNGNFDFVLINAHLDPDNVSTEFPELYDASAEAWGLFEHELDIIALGDFNFDCNYQEESQKSPLPEHDYTWLIPDSADTNVARSDCTYDRIIIDYAMGSEDSTGNAGVFRFDDHYNLSYDQAKAVSDHYPVWAEFKINEDTR